MLLDSIFKLGGKVIDTIFEDKDEANKHRAALALKLADGDQKLADLEKELEVELVKARSAVVVAEAQGESWLQRSWRGVTMLTFTGLVVAHWLGFTPPTLPHEEVMALLDLIKLGLGGFVLGRSAEKVTQAWRGTGPSQAQVIERP